MICIFRQFFTAFLITLALLTALSQAQINQDAPKRKILIAAIPANTPPAFYKDIKTNAAAGFAVDVTDAIAKEAGYSVTYLFKRTWSEVIDAVRYGEADIAPSMAISKEREKILAFTLPIETMTVSVFVRKNSSITELQDGMSVGARTGSVSLERARKRLKSNVVTYESAEEGLLGLLSGQIDAYLAIDATIFQLARTAGIEDKIKIIGPPVDELKRAIALRKDDRHLLAELNKAVNDFVGSSEYMQAYAKWYGKPEPYWTIQRIIFYAVSMGVVIIVIMAVWRHYSVVNLNKALLQTIEDRRKAETALRKSEERFRQAMETSSHGLWDWDIENDAGYFSPAYYRILGYEPNEFPMTSKSWVDLIHPDDRERTLSINRDCIENRLPNFEVQYRMKAKDGSWKWIQGRGEAMSRDAHGHALRMIGTHVDITERKHAEEALRMSEEKFRKVFQSSADSININRLEDGMYVSINHGFTEMTGYTEADVTGKTSLELDIWVDPMDRLKIVEKLRTDGEARNFEARFRAKDGRIIDGLMSATVIEVDHVKYLVNITRDVTERKAREAEIERLNRLYAVLSQVNQAVVRVHSRDELFKQVCGILIESGGLKLAWVGWHDQSAHKVTVVAQHGDETGYLDDIRVFADERPEGRGPTGTAIKEGKPFISNNFRNDPRTLPWHTAASLTSWHAAAGFPIRLAGEVCYALTVYANEANFFGDREVALLEEVAVTVSFGLEALGRETHRRQAEERVRETASRLEMAARAGKVGLWDWDLRTNRVFFSPEWKRQIGYEDHEISSDFTEWQSRIHPDDRELSAQSIQAFIKKPKPDYHTELRLRHKNGSYRWILEQASLINDERGRPIRMLGSHVDITEQRKLEDQLRQAQKMEAVGQLGGGVAHDFNNILSAIVGYSHLSLMKMSPGDPNRYNIEQILESSERAAELTQRLLSFSRKQVVNLTSIDLNDVVAKFEKFLLRLLREDIDLKKMLTTKALPIMADRGQLEQALMNLVTNSRDAMPQGGRITIETSLINADQSFVKKHDFDREGNYALLSVTDTGIGIPENIKDKIFEPFFTTKEEGKGTGLGLSMVYGIVKKHEGYVTVYSQPGVGTTIKIYLPLTHAAAEAEQQKNNDQNSFRGGTETVLIAEDNASLRSLTATILQNSGYTVIEAVDGLDAVAKFAEHRDSIRLVILDGIMPNMNGKDAWMEIKALASGIKAIFLSGYAEDIFTKDGIPDREASYIQKPYPPLILMKRVREVLDE